MRNYNDYIKMKKKIFDMEHTIEIRLYTYLMGKGLFNSLKTVEIGKSLLSDKITLVFDTKLAEKEINEFAKTFDLRCVGVTHSVTELEGSSIEEYSYCFKNLNILRFEDKYYDKIVNGDKSKIILHTKPIKIGETVWGEFERINKTLKLEITNIEIKQFKDLGLNEANNYGLDNFNNLNNKQKIDELKRRLKYNYNFLIGDYLVYCYEFKVIE